MKIEVSAHVKAAVPEVPGLRVQLVPVPGAGDQHLGYAGLTMPHGNQGSFRMAAGCRVSLNV